MTCAHETTRVINSIPPETRGYRAMPGVSMIRRRLCKECGERFTTYEITREQYLGALPPEEAVKRARNQIVDDLILWLRTK